jgi:hypothetical protein
LSGFLLGVILGVFGLAYAVITKPSKAVSILNPMQAPTPHRYGECPYCRERIRRDASVCPHCRRDVPPQAPPPPPVDTSYTWTPPP